MTSSSRVPSLPRPTSALTAITSPTFSTTSAAPGNQPPASTGGFQTLPSASASPTSRSVFGSFVSSIGDALTFNQATLSGAIDVIVVSNKDKHVHDDAQWQVNHAHHADVELLSTPFHVRFGKLQLLKSREKVISVEVNGKPAPNFSMKLGSAGEAFFVLPGGEGDETVDQCMASPIVSPSVSPFTGATTPMGSLAHMPEIDLSAAPVPQSPRRVRSHVADGQSKRVTSSPVLRSASQSMQLFSPRPLQSPPTSAPHTRQVSEAPLDLRSASTQASKSLQKQATISEHDADSNEADADAMTSSLKNLNLRRDQSIASTTVTQPLSARSFSEYSPRHSSTTAPSNSIPSSPLLKDHSSPDTATQPASGLQNSKVSRSLTADNLSLLQHGNKTAAVRQQPHSTDDSDYPNVYSWRFGSRPSLTSRTPSASQRSATTRNTANNSTDEDDDDVRSQEQRRGWLSIFNIFSRRGEAQQQQPQRRGRAATVDYSMYNAVSDQQRSQSADYTLHDSERDTLQTQSNTAIEAAHTLTSLASSKPSSPHKLASAHSRTISNDTQPLVNVDLHVASNGEVRSQIHNAHSPSSYTLSSAESGSTHAKSEPDNDPQLSRHLTPLDILQPRALSQPVSPLPQRIDPTAKPSDRTEQVPFKRSSNRSPLDDFVQPLSAPPQPFSDGFAAIDTPVEQSAAHKHPQTAAAKTSTVSSNDRHGNQYNDSHELEAILPEIQSGPLFNSPMALSLCGDLLPFADDQSITRKFADHAISYERLCTEPELIYNDHLVVLYQNKLYPGKVALPLLVSELVFGQPLLMHGDTLARLTGRRPGAPSRIVSKNAAVSKGVSHEARSASFTVPSADETSRTNSDNIPTVASYLQAKNRNSAVASDNNSTDPPPAQKSTRDQSASKVTWRDWLRRKQQPGIETNKLPQHTRASTVPNSPMADLNNADAEPRTADDRYAAPPSTDSSHEPHTPPPASNPTGKAQPTLAISDAPHVNAKPASADEFLNKHQQGDGTDTDTEAPSAYSARRLYRKSLHPTSDMLKSLNLKQGRNTITYTVTSKLQGIQRITSCIYFWAADTKIIVSDVDGTITASDVLGNILPLVGKDWSHAGIAQLYSKIAANGYEMLYLTSRAIGQSNLTRAYLSSLRQDHHQLPDGPLILSPDRLYTSFKREVIDRRPQEFKIIALRAVRELFVPEHNCFSAGFGNRLTDIIAYRHVGIPNTKIFIVNANSQLQHINSAFCVDYRKLADMVDSIFPPRHIASKRKLDAEFENFAYWRQPMANIDELLSAADQLESQTQPKENGKQAATPAYTTGATRTQQTSVKRQFSTASSVGKDRNVTRSDSDDDSDSSDDDSDNDNEDDDQIGLLIR